MPLGPPFLTKSLAPLHYANICVMGKKVLVGLRELDPKNLKKNLREAIEFAAKEGKLRPRDIQRMLPMAEFARLLAIIGQHQAVTAQYWAQQNVESGRVADMADLTKTGNMPSLPRSLLRLADKLDPNSQAAISVRTLSEAVDQWQALILKQGAVLDDEDALKVALSKTRQATRHASRVESCGGHARSDQGPNRIRRSVCG